MLFLRRALLALATVTCALGTLLDAAPAAAQASLIRGLGGPAGFGTGEVAPNDDGYSAQIDITPAFPGGLRFFRTTPWTYMYVDNNGNLTFGGSGCSNYTPIAFPLPTTACAGSPIIAPWWADVDTRGDGRPSMNGVYYDVRPGQITVTWDRVGVFPSNDAQQNSFQVILRASPECGDGDFDVEFRYNQCQWYVGTASGGMTGTGVCAPGTAVSPDGGTSSGSCTPAQVGFDAGDGMHFYTLPGSRTVDVMNICRGTNVGMSGVYRFQIRGGELPCMGSGDVCTVASGQGVCADGHIQCRMGMPVCAADTGPSPERCDGADNDCNGMIDDGAHLCTPGFVCDRGSCVPSCVEGSCFEGQTCTARNTCVDTACLTVMCTQGELCQRGMCVPACDNIRCPPPTTCRLGRCIDPCDGVTCDPGNVCENGLCVLSCRCRPCGANQACSTTGTCVPAECLGVTCADNQFCRAGMCINGCDVASCPEGQVCDPSEGRCVAGVSGPDVVAVDAVVADTARPDGGSGEGGMSDASSADGGAMDSAAAPDTAACFGASCRPVTATCHCSTPGVPARSMPRGAFALGALALGALLVRRRR